MEFDVVIGNPPYNGGLYCKFMENTGRIVSNDGYFDILLPSYTFTRKTSLIACRDFVHLESVDFTVGKYFANSISGTWVARFRGKVGRTDDKPIKLILTNGDVIHTKLSDINPTSQKFIKPNGLVPEDISIVRKVLTSTIEFQTHKTNKLSGSFVYLRPTLKYISKPSPAAGSFNLHGVCNQWTEDVKNGWYIQTDKPDKSNKIFDIYTKSKLFIFVNWMMISDFPMVSKSYISMLPDVTNISYKNESELYEQFGLTDSEINRIESILKS